MTTTHVAMRQLVDADLDFLAEMLGDAHVMQYWPKLLDRDEAEQWLRKQQERYKTDGCGYWLIVDRDTHKPVGQAGVLITEIEGERLPCIGYMIHRPFQRMGYGASAADICVEYIFNTLKADAAWTLVRPENEPSFKLAKKLGFEEIRTIEYAGFPHVLLKRAR